MHPLLKSLATVTAGLLLTLSAVNLHADEDAKAQQLFETIFNDAVERSPLFQTYLGMKTNYDKWDDISAARDAEDHEISKQQLQRLHELDASKLSASNQVSYRLMEEQLLDEQKHHDAKG